MKFYCPDCGNELRVISQMHCHHVDWFYECDMTLYRWPSRCGYDSKEELEKHVMKAIKRTLNDVRVKEIA
jgi:predicted RNA-binding Zn-ribbon protein involved in translation (DUF1610 family)